MTTIYNKLPVRSKKCLITLFVYIHTESFLCAVFLIETKIRGSYVDLRYFFCVSKWAYISEMSKVGVNVLGNCNYAANEEILIPSSTSNIACAIL